MSISRWDPWGDIVSLREAMNALFEDGYVRSRGATNGVMFGLAVDVEETPEAFLIHASVPGVKAGRCFDLAPRRHDFDPGRAQGYSFH